jgi:hypothetical protein
MDDCLDWELTAHARVLSALMMALPAWFIYVRLVEVVTAPLS